MKHRYTITFLFLLLAIFSNAQTRRIYGTVKHNNQPVANANVVELDANHRYLSHTKTDEWGKFTLTVTGEKTSIRVTHDDMTRFTSKIGNQENWNITLNKKPKSEKDKPIKKTYESTRLLAGIAQGRFIPQLVCVEQLSDTTFCLVIPVRVYSSVEDYPQGRKAVVQDYNSRIIATGNCIDDAIAQEGIPQRWDPIVRTTAIEGPTFTHEVRDFFCYPRFLFTKTELEYMIDHSSELSCFAVDTARGDNYWMYYPCKTFAKEMQKILNKMLK